MKNRSEIIDWLSKMHSQMELFPQTFFIAINYLDRFLSKERVN